MKINRNVDFKGENNVLRQNFERDSVDFYLISRINTVFRLLNQNFAFKNEV